MIVVGSRPSPERTFTSIAEFPGLIFLVIGVLGVLASALSLFFRFSESEL
jgi:hypothetical protein